MKKASVFAVCSMLVLALGTFGALASEKAENAEASHVVLKVEGMTCGGCCTKIETAVKELDGVLNAKADYKNGSATITYKKDKVSVEKIVATINEKTSFKASMPEDEG